MEELNKPRQVTYWLAYTDDKLTVHWGVINPDQQLTTGLPNLEHNISKDVIIARLTALGYKFDELEIEHFNLK